MVSKAEGIIFILLLITIGCTSISQREQLKTSSDQQVNIDSSGKPTENHLVVVLSFDYEDMGTDIGKKNLPSTFQILEKHRAKATFFILGKTADEDPDTVKEIYSRGHSLGLHTSIHHFPIFTREDALEIEEVYKTMPDYVWDRSFKIPDVFIEDLERNRKSMINAVDDDIELKMFRCPSLVVNWTRDPEYFAALKEAGIEIDSSLFRETNDKEPFYSIYGIVEVPVSVSETGLSDVPVLDKVVKKYSEDRLPFVMYIHPQKLTPDDIITLDEFLSSLEKEYEVKYLKVDEVPAYYGR